MGVECNNDEAFRNLEDIVEYDPTEFSTSSKSVDLLTKIAGGDYWKGIVSRYRSNEIDGYTAESEFSTEYKKKLRCLFTYVLDMPIRLKRGQRPKYRMVHACNHEHGCSLMVENMHKRKDELFLNVQQGRQHSLFDCDGGTAATIDNRYITREQIAERLSAHIKTCETSVGYTVLLASFFNEHGLLCDTNMFRSILVDFERAGSIDILRLPPQSLTGRATTFWDEKNGRRITIRRKSSCSP